MASTLTKERRGEIAETLFVNYLLEKGLTLHSGQQLKGELYDLSKKTKIPEKELFSFFQPILEEIIKQAFHGH